MHLQVRPAEPVTLLLNNSSPFHNCDFIGSQAVEAVNQTADLLVGGFYLTLYRPALGFGLGQCKLLVHRQHRIDQLDNAVMRGQEASLVFALPSLDQLPPRFARLKKKAAQAYCKVNGKKGP